VAPSGEAVSPRVSPHKRSRTGRPRGSVDRTVALRDPGDIAACRRRATFIGPAIQEAREAAGASADELAARIGRCTSVVHRYESGRSVPPLPVVIAIARALGVSVASLATELDL
jgi:ribosome-binding protein aMBF1 (putative translation factor)